MKNLSAYSKYGQFKLLSYTVRHLTHDNAQQIDIRNMCNTRKFMKIKVYISLQSFAVFLLCIFNLVALLFAPANFLLTNFTNSSVLLASWDGSDSDLLVGYRVYCRVAQINCSFVITVCVPNSHIGLVWKPIETRPPMLALVEADTTTW